jgi:long-subunit fatty acid transport protein
VDLAGIGTLQLALTGVTHYTPHTLQFGAAFDVTEKLTVALDGEYALWSMAPSPYMGLDIDVSGDVLEALGLDDALSVSSLEQAAGFHNTFGARLGVEYRFAPRFTLRGGMFIRPTPVPRQDVPGTNILDGTAIGTTFGFGFNFDDPLEIFKSPVIIDFAAQAHFLLPREANKELTDSVPSYRYEAKALGLSVSVRYDF